MIELGLIFVLGLVSSVHCVQMCGPVVLSYSLPLARAGVTRRRMLAAHASYHAGRILIYTLLGALAGGASGMIGRMAGFAGGARIFAGGAMVVAGLAMLGLLPSNGLVTIEPKGVASCFSRAIGRLMMSPLPGSKFQLGLLLGFLPCGLIYGALLKSVDAGAALPGALTMLAFGLGTVAALLSVGLASGFLGRYLGRWSNQLAAVSLMLMGAFLLWRGIAAPPAPSCHVHS